MKKGLSFEECEMRVKDGGEWGVTGYGGRRSFSMVRIMKGIGCGECMI